MTVIGKPTNLRSFNIKTDSSLHAKNIMGRAFVGHAAGKAAYGVGKAAWKRYNPWRKGGRWGPKYKKVYGGRRGRMRISGYYGRFNRTPTSEWKFIDQIIIDALLATGGTIASTSINGIAQGTSESERIGRKCAIKSIDWKIALQKASSQNTTADDVARIILYLDKQANGAAPAILDLLETADFQSHYNLSNSNRFRILMDRTTAVNGFAGSGNGTANDSHSRTIIQRYHKRCNIPLEFSSTTGTLTEIRSNNIGVLTISRDGTIGLESVIRVRFSG